MTNYYMTPQQLYQYIDMLNSRIVALEKKVDELSQELTTIKDTPKINVEKIEYKFDQLKVESLDGTLNIGLNPSNLKDTIEDMAVDQNVNVDSIKDLTPYKERITKEIQAYIQNEVPALIQDNEMQFQRSLDPSYYEMVQQDLLNQMPQRIDFYLENIPHVESKQSEGEWERKIISKIKQDIQTALFSFMSQMPENMEGMNNNEPPSNQS
ncbi:MULTISPECIES: spore germination protein GerPC [Rossellomorea]|uniref:spore germination protein GerPC n=1 Tax=Rossellomorea TaxID=2837508 RepID=UPI001CCD5B50|nr:MULTISPECIES: spore germination protein GerPC [Rossellomorea]MCA0149009.1 spore germination protein GerPC [Rossellomorea vietnamensis]WGG47159.1 spore germination protein GerPC [Rossellomorea sp. DA94]